MLVGVKVGALENQRGVRLCMARADITTPWTTIVRPPFVLPYVDDAIDFFIKLTAHSQVDDAVAPRERQASCTTPAATAAIVLWTQGMAYSHLAASCDGWKWQLW